MTTLLKMIEGKVAEIRDNFTAGLISQQERDQAVALLHVEVQAMNHPDLTNYDLAVERLALAQLNQSNARKELVALLPEAAPAQMEVILKCTADGQQIPAKCLPGLAVRLTDSQKATLKKVGDDRKAWLTRNRDIVIEEVKADAGDLTGYTVRVGTNATTTRLTFTKNLGTKPTVKKLDGRELVSMAVDIAAGKS